MKKSQERKKKLTMAVYVCVTASVFLGAKTFVVFSLSI